MTEQKVVVASPCPKKDSARVCVAETVVSGLRRSRGARSSGNLKVDFSRFCHAQRVPCPGCTSDPGGRGESEQSGGLTATECCATFRIRFGDEQSAERVQISSETGERHVTFESDLRTIATSFQSIAALQCSAWPIRYPDDSAAPPEILRQHRSTASRTALLRASGDTDS